MLTQEYLKSILHYNPETGIFTRISNNSRWNGKEAGTVMNRGYIHISISGKQYLGHRLAFLYVTGTLPKYIDHINMDRSDNRWSNLRPCSNSQNIAHASKPKSQNKSGFRGVHWHKQSKKWAAQVRKNGKIIYSKRFSSPEVAYEAYKKAHSEAFGEFSPFFSAG